MPSFGSDARPSIAAVLGKLKVYERGVGYVDKTPVGSPIAQAAVTKNSDSSGEFEDALHMKIIMIIMNFENDSAGKYSYDVHFMNGSTQQTPSKPKYCEPFEPHPLY